MDAFIPILSFIQFRYFVGVVLQQKNTKVNNLNIKKRSSICLCDEDSVITG